MTTSLRRITGLTALLAASPIALLAADAAPTVVTKSLLQELSAPAIFPLWFCSALIVYLVIELYMKIQPKQFIPPATLDTLRTFFRNGDYHGAYNWTRDNPGILANVVHAGLKTPRAASRPLRRPWARRSSAKTPSSKTKSPTSPSSALSPR